MSTKTYKSTERNRERARKFYYANRERYLLRKYGLTEQLWEALFASQGRKCASCGSSEPRGSNKHWHTDHDHRTGKVRGILCSCCNLAIGVLLDSPVDLRRAADYLERQR